MKDLDVNLEVRELRPVTVHLGQQQIPEIY